MALIKTLIPLLSPAAIALFVILAMANTAQSQTTSFYYDFNGDQPTTLTYQGAAHFPADSTYLRLTRAYDTDKPLMHSPGRVLYSDPIPFSGPNAQVDLETTITFIVKPNGNDTNPADGIAFFIAPVKSTIPRDSDDGKFGIFNSTGGASSVFAVEFDIFPDKWDPDSPHVGIDIESVESVITKNISHSLIGEVVTLRVNYVEAAQLIRVVVLTDSQRYALSYNANLSAILPQQVQVGIGASTGVNVALHEVVSWYFSSTLVTKLLQGEYIRQIV